MRRAVFVAMLGAACAASAAEAQERTAVWSGWAEDGYGGAVDCTDCIEEEYIALSCEGGSRAVAVELIGLVPGENPGARIDVTLAVDGVAESRAAEIESSEMFGPVPLLTLPGDDPLFARLREGRVLTMAIENDRLEIPLTGVGEALDVMLAACR